MSKLMTLNEAVRFINDGDTVAIGGMLLQQVPMALIRGIVRKGVKNLNLKATAQGIGADLLIGADCVKSIEFAFISFELYGFAHNFKRAAEEGRIELKEAACYALISGFRAGAWGLPFLPIRGLFGTDILKVREEFKVIEDPFDGEKLVLIPAIKPNVAIIHAHRADLLGNAQIEGSSWDDLIAKASEKVIVTTEEIVSTEEIKRNPEKTKIPHFLVNAVVKVSYGAHPTGCQSLYDHDEEHIKKYIEASKDSTKFQEYLNEFVFHPKTHEEYLELIGGIEKISKLRW